MLKWGSSKGHVTETGSGGQEENLIRIVSFALSKQEFVTSLYARMGEFKRFHHDFIASRVQASPVPAHGPGVLHIPAKAGYVIRPQQHDHECVRLNRILKICADRLSCPDRQVRRVQHQATLQH